MTSARRGARAGWVRGLRWAVITVAVAVLVTTLVALPYTVFPESTPIPREVDAVIVLAGGEGERLERALASMNRAVGPPASLLLISGGRASDWPEANELCGTAPGAYSVACFDPQPSTTGGEARALASMAATQGWDALAIVTSTHHITRARRAAERCFDGEIQMIAASPDYPWADRVRASLRELVAIVRDRFDPPEC